MSNRLATIVVVTGTDTEIGKTFVGCALATAACRRGWNVAAIKPVESGTALDVEPHEDGVLLARAAGQTAPMQALQRLREPLAPPDAAEIDGVELNWEAWIASVREAAALNDLVLVEGAGGVLSPLTWDEDALDLARTLRARVLLVAADRLGTQNHTRLALREIRRRGLELLGVILSAPAEPDRSTGRNQAVLEKVTDGVDFLTVSRHDDPKDAASDVDPVCDWIEASS